MPEMNEKKMHKELLQSLKNLLPYTYQPSRIKRVMDEIKKHQLSANYNEKVLGFILKLLDEMPEIMKAKPHDQALKNLCQYCIEHVVAQESLESESRPKFSSRKE